MNKKSRWIILGGLLILGLVLLGRGMMRHDDIGAVAPTVEASDPVASQPAEVQLATVAQAPPEVRAPQRDATPETRVAPPVAHVLRGRVYDEDTGAPIGDARIVAMPQRYHGGSALDSV